MPLVWMSRSAMPAAWIAAITLSICTALARIAALASAAWVTTPVEMVATSGTRVASAVADTDSSVPRRGDGDIGGVCALAVMGKATARERAKYEGTQDHGELRIDAGEACAWRGWRQVNGSARGERVVSRNGVVTRCAGTVRSRSRVRLPACCILPRARHDAPNCSPAWAWISA